MKYALIPTEKTGYLPQNSDLCRSVMANAQDCDQADWRFLIEHTFSEQKHPQLLRLYHYAFVGVECGLSLSYSVMFIYISMVSMQGSVLSAGSQTPEITVILFTLHLNLPGVRNYVALS